MSKKSLLIGLGVAVGLALLVYIGTWVSVLAAEDPLNHRLAAWNVWPVACSTRGCITSQSWNRQHQLAIAFSRAANQDKPSPRQTLTTAVRRHLAANAFLRSPVTLADARRYREDVLNIANGEQIQEVLGVGVDEYDRQIILPFLQQQALAEEKRAESMDELYAVLADERFIAVLPFRLTWDTEKGEIISR